VFDFWYSKSNLFNRVELFDEVLTQYLTEKQLIVLVKRKYFGKALKKKTFSAIFANVIAGVFLMEECHHELVLFLMRRFGFSIGALHFWVNSQPFAKRCIGTYIASNSW